MSDRPQKVLAHAGVVHYYITTSLIHGDTNQETHMTTQISTKLAALGIALMMNVAMMGAIAYVFNAQAGNGQTSPLRLAAL